MLKELYEYNLQDTLMLFKTDKEMGMANATALRTGHFIVGSISKIGGLNFNNHPHIHYNETDAKAEAERLTRQHGKDFVVVEVKGVVGVAEVVWK